MYFRRCIFVVATVLCTQGWTSMENLSPPEYEGTIKVEVVRVPMRDGVELAVQIIRPDAEGQFPAVMGYNPYRRVYPVMEDYRDYAPRYVPYLAERGYVMIHYDVRGTGNSEGVSHDIYSDEERQDAYDMVEWIARQPWCNGNVGMKGISYGGVVQWQTAVQEPPSLKAIIVRSANDSVYTEWTYPGGALRPYMFDTFSPFMTAFNFSPPDPEIVGDKWKEMWLERLENNRPWGIGFISNQQDNNYWQDRSLSADYSRVKAATMVIGGWSDVYPTALLRAYSNLKAPKRAMVGPWMHIYSEEVGALPGPRIDGRPIYLRFFDYWLKGIDNGIMDEPPVLIYVKEYDPPASRMPLEEPGFWRLESDWPIPRARSTPLYFKPGGELSFQPDSSSEKALSEPVALESLRYNPAVGITSGIHWGGGILPWGNPVDQRLDEAYSLVYTTPPLEKKVEVTGHPEAVLYISSTADRAYFRVKLIDVAPDGTSKLVRYGGLNATHRNSHLSPEALVPGEVYEVRVPVKAMSYVFDKGHRIRVAIANADMQNAWPTARNAVNTLYRLSHVVLPVIPSPDVKIREPRLIRLPTADPAVAVEPRRPSRYSIEHDLLNDTTIMHMGKQGSRGGIMSGPGDKGPQVSEVRSRFTVSNTQPANAELEAEYVNTIRSADSVIEVKAHEVVRSDDDHFYYDSKVEIFIDDEPFFDKSWSTSVRRILN